MSMQEPVCPLCGNIAAEGLLCSGCLANSLYYKQQAIAYQQVALRDSIEQVKTVLAARQPVSETENALAEIVRQHSRAREELHKTAERVRGLRPTVARRKFMLEDRRRTLAAANERLEELMSWHYQRSRPILEGLQWYMEQVEETVQLRIWTRVLEHFVIFPIEADVPSDQRSTVRDISATGPGLQRRTETRGVSIIAGLPLPNSGNYKEVVEAALYLVARLTWSLAQTFQLDLPHPLIFPAGKCFAVIAEDPQFRTQYVLSPAHSQQSSTEEIATARILSVTGGSHIKGHGEEAFQIGLEYLQYNVHRLAIAEEVGVDLASLYGREAILLNLWAIQQLAVKQTIALQGVPDLPLPIIRPPDRETTSSQAGQANPRITFQEQEEWALVDLDRRGQMARSNAGQALHQQEYGA